MTYQEPSAKLEQSGVTRDEWFALVLLFIIWAYSQWSKHEAIDKCTEQGGVANVANYFFGTVWKVECYK